MNKKTSSMVLACLLAVSIICQQTAAAGSTPDKEARVAQKVKAAILELGSGPSTTVSIKLRDKTRLTGCVSEIGDNSFTVTDLKTGEITKVSHPDVVQVKGNNLSTGVKIAIGVAIIVGIAIVLYIVRGAFCDGC
jgi:exosome complex RNA-binding protein Rrp4